MFHSIKKQINLSILTLSSLLLFALFLAFLYDAYFIPRVYSVEEFSETYLGSVIKQNGQNQRLTLISKENSYLLKRMSSIPFVNQKRIEEIKDSLNSLRKFPSSALFAFRTLNNINISLIKAVKKATEIFMAIFVVVILLSIIIVISLSKTIRKHLLSHVKSISEQLSSFSLFHQFKSENSSYVETERLIDGFNLMARRVKLYRIVLNLGGRSRTLQEFAKELFSELKKSIEINRLTFAEILRNKMIVKEALNDSKRVIIGKGFSQELSEESLNTIKSRRIHVVNNIEDYLKSHPYSIMGSIFEEGMRSALILPLCVGGECDALLFLSSFKKDTFKKEDIEDLKVVANVLALLHKKTVTVQNLVLSTLVGLTKLVEGKDEETGEHLVRMASYSRAIAEQLAKNPKFSKILTLDFIERIHEQAPLHDIGKVSVPDYILRKPGKLNSDEFEIMKNHTTNGYAILDQVDLKSHEHFFEIGKEIVRSHHERWDGRGYPDGLKGEEIPLCARIVAVGDVLDALTTERPYKKALGYDKSVEIIVEESGTHFDPQVIEAFIEAQPKIRKLYKDFHKILKFENLEHPRKNKPQRGKEN